MPSRGGRFGTTVLLVGGLEAPPLLSIIHFCDIKGKVVNIKNVPIWLCIFRHTDFIKIKRMNFEILLIHTNLRAGRHCLQNLKEVLSVSLS